MCCLAPFPSPHALVSKLSGNKRKEAFSRENTGQYAPWHIQQAHHERLTNAQPGISKSKLEYYIYIITISMLFAWIQCKESARTEHSGDTHAKLLRPPLYTQYAWYISKILIFLKSNVCIDCVCLWNPTCKHDACSITAYIACINIDVKNICLCDLIAWYQWWLYTPVTQAKLLLLALSTQYAKQICILILINSYVCVDCVRLRSPTSKA